MAAFFKNMMEKFRSFDEDAMDYGYETAQEPIQDQSEELGYSLNLHEEQLPLAQERNMRVVDARPQQQMVIVYPNQVDSAKAISSHIKAGRTVICNFEKCEQFPPQRILDFINGAVFALGGQVQALSGSIFLVLPQSVSIMDNPQQTQQNLPYARQA